MTTKDINDFYKDMVKIAEPSKREIRKSEKRSIKLCDKLIKEKGERGKHFSIR